MLMRFDPFRELDRFAEQLWNGVPVRPVVMPMEAYRHGDRFVSRFDLPGIDLDSLEVTVDKNVLTVSAKREAQLEGAEVIVAERPYGTFTRQLFLGEGLDSEHIEASYDAGVLTVTIPVAEEARPRKIEITRGQAEKELVASHS